MQVRVPFAVPVPPRDIILKVMKKRLFIGVKGKPAIIDGELHEEVKHEDYTWQSECSGHIQVINFSSIFLNDLFFGIKWMDQQSYLPWTKQEIFGGLI